jgi:hypothetical protein
VVVLDLRDIGDMRDLVEAPANVFVHREKRCRRDNKDKQNRQHETAAGRRLRG